MQSKPKDKITIIKYIIIHKLLIFIIFIIKAVLQIIKIAAVPLVFTVPLFLPKDFNIIYYICILIGLFAFALIIANIINRLESLDKKYNLFPPDPEPKSSYELYGQDASIWD